MTLVEVLPTTAFSLDELRKQVEGCEYAILFDPVRIDMSDLDSCGWPEKFDACFIPAINLEVPMRIFKVSQPTLT